MRVIPAVHLEEMCGVIIHLEDHPDVHDIGHPSGHHVMIIEPKLVRMWLIRETFILIRSVLLVVGNIRESGVRVIRAVVQEGGSIERRCV